MTNGQNINLLYNDVLNLFCSMAELRGLTIIHGAVYRVSHNTPTLDLGHDISEGVSAFISTTC